MPASPTFNGPIWNAGLWGGGRFTVAQYSTDTLVFYDLLGNAFSLSDGSTMLMENLTLNGPSREILGGPVPRDDGQFVTASYFREFVIESSGIVNASSAALLDAQLDTIKRSLQDLEGYLDYIDANGTVKRFRATLVNYDDLFAGRRGYHITFCPWRARFVCKTPLATSRDYVTSMATIDSSPHTETLSNTGTYKAQPIIIMVFDSASSVTVVNLKRINSAGTTLEEIEYSGSMSAGDLLEFNSEAKQVLKNGAAVDYTGGFLSLPIGSHLITFGVTGSSFSTTTTFKHKKFYL